MIAIIRTGGKQYQVAEKERIKVEKIDAEVGTTVEFETLFVGDDTSAHIGTPVLEGTSVKGKILSQGRFEKVRGIRYKPKKRELTKYGHRQPYTEVEITEIADR